MGIEIDGVRLAVYRESLFSDSPWFWNSLDPRASRFLRQPGLRDVSLGKSDFSVEDTMSYTWLVRRKNNSMKVQDWILFFSCKILVRLRISVCGILKARNFVTMWDFYEVFRNKWNSSCTVETDSFGKVILEYIGIK